MAASLAEYAPEIRVVDPETEPWISATQVDTFELCPRKWAWRWLAKIYAPPNKFAQLGLETHGQLEGWLKDARVPVGEKDAELAQALIPYLPPPQAVERENVENDVLLVVEDVLFVLKVDLFMPEFSPRPRVFDHKTCGSFDWCVRGELMHENVQAALYGCWAIVATRQTEIELQWNYVRTKGAPKVEPVTGLITPESIVPRMRKSLETARAIKWYLANTTDALQVPHDATACEQYGGCPYRQNCNLTPEERIAAIMNDPRNNPATHQLLQSLPGNGAAVNPPPFNPGQLPPPPGMQQQQQPAQQSFGQLPPPPGMHMATQGPAPGLPPPSFNPGQLPPPPGMQQQPPPPFNPGALPPPPGVQQQPPPQAYAPQPQQQQQPQPTMQQQPLPMQQQQPQVQYATAPIALPAPQQQWAQLPAPAAPPQEKRQRSSKEYGMDGAWVTFAASAIQLTGGNAQQAAQIADALLSELKQRQ